MENLEKFYQNKKKNWKIKERKSLDFGFKENIDNNPSFSNFNEIRFCSESYVEEIPFLQNCITKLHRELLQVRIEKQNLFEENQNLFSLVQDFQENYVSRFEHNEILEEIRNMKSKNRDLIEKINELQHENNSLNENIQKFNSNSRKVEKECKNCSFVDSLKSENSDLKIKLSLSQNEQKQQKLSLEHLKQEKLFLETRNFSIEKGLIQLSNKVNEGKTLEKKFKEELLKSHSLIDYLEEKLKVMSVDFANCVYNFENLQMKWEYLLSELEDRKIIIRINEERRNFEILI